MKKELYKYCEVCGIGFKAERNSSKYCSHQCRTKAYRVRRAIEGQEYMEKAQQDHLDEEECKERVEKEQTAKIIRENDLKIAEEDRKRRAESRKRRFKHRNMITEGIDVKGDLLGRLVFGLIGIAAIAGAVSYKKNKTEAPQNIVEHKPNTKNA